MRHHVPLPECCTHVVPSAKLMQLSLPDLYLPACLAVHLPAATWRLAASRRTTQIKTGSCRWAGWWLGAATGAGVGSTLSQGLALARGAAPVLSLALHSCHLSTVTCAACVLPLQRASVLLLKQMQLPFTAFLPPPSHFTPSCLPTCPLQHASVPLLKEMLLTLDLARVCGSSADQRAADRLQRRLLHDDLKESGLLPVGGRGWGAKGGLAWAGE